MPQDDGSSDGKDCSFDLKSETQPKPAAEWCWLCVVKLNVWILHRGDPYLDDQSPMPMCYAGSGYNCTGCAESTKTCNATPARLKTRAVALVGAVLDGNTDLSDLAAQLDRELEDSIEESRLEAQDNMNVKMWQEMSREEAEECDQVDRWEEHNLLEYERPWAGSAYDLEA